MIVQTQNKAQAALVAKTVAALAKITSKGDVKEQSGVSFVAVAMPRFMKDAMSAPTKKPAPIVAVGAYPLAPTIGLALARSK